MDNDWYRAYQRERQARLRAEQLLEEKTRQLYVANCSLQRRHEQLKARQQHLLQSEKMASIGMLAAGVAHEINNPVGYVRSNLHVLAGYLERLDSGDELAPEERAFIQADTRDLLSETIEGLDRIGTIVADLQQFARKSDETVKPADLNGAVRSVLNILAHKTRYHGEITVMLQDLPKVTCDVAKISQVILNLVMNAVQASPQDAAISVGTERIGEFVTLSVKDGGCGIPEDDLNRIFDPFFTTKDPGEGTGLGLALSYRIVQEHGGDIRVVSAPREGSRFDVTLPIAGPGGSGDEEVPVPGSMTGTDESSKPLNRSGVCSDTTQ